MKKIIILILILSLGLFAVTAHGEQEVGYDDHHDDMMGSNFGFYGMGMFWWYILLVFIIAVVVFVASGRKITLVEGKK
jgi:hypothetical protein